MSDIVCEMCSDPCLQGFTMLNERESIKMKCEQKFMSHNV